MHTSRVIDCQGICSNIFASECHQGIIIKVFSEILFSMDLDERF